MDRKQRPLLLWLWRVKSLQLHDIKRGRDGPLNLVISSFFSSAVTDMARKLSAAMLVLLQTM